MGCELTLAAGTEGPTCPACDHVEVPAELLGRVSIGDDEIIHVFRRDDGTTVEALEGDDCAIGVWACPRCGDVGPVAPRREDGRCASCGQRFYEYVALGWEGERGFDPAPQFEGLAGWDLE
jgi:hypothetical protein